MNSSVRGSEPSPAGTARTRLSRRPLHPAPRDVGKGPSPAREKMGRALRKLRENALVSKMMVSGFRGLQRLGVTVIPNHFYWPVPDIQDLESRAWPVESDPVGFDLGLERQVNWAGQLAARYRMSGHFRTGRQAPLSITTTMVCLKPSMRKWPTASFAASNPRALSRSGVGSVQEF